MLRNSSIKLRLTLIIMSISFVSVMLTTLAISIIGVYSLSNNLIQELDVTASIVGDRNTAALLFNDDKQAQNNLNVFSVNHTIVQACLYNQTGTLFARYINSKYELDSKCPTEMFEHISVSQSRIELMKPISMWSPLNKR